jgi:two-component system OmpR family response regulator
VLLVEDNRLLRWCVSCGLRRGGYEVVEPENVKDALREENCQPVNVLVTDYRLASGLNGYDVLCRVREKNPKIGSILISAEADPEAKLEAYGAGFDFVFAKPFHLSEVVAAVAALLSERSSQPAS